MSRTPLRILMVSSEAHPFSKSGGLADVASSLSKAVGVLGHHVTLVSPRYRGVSGGERRGSVRVFVADRWLDGEFYLEPLGDRVDAVLVDCPALYDRPGLYGEGGGDYADNPRRFAFLSIAALEWARQRQEPYAVLHGHDWQAGLLPVYARRLLRPSGADDERSKPPACVLTIHNLAFQGVFDQAWVPALGLEWRDFTPRGFEFWDRVSFLKAGVVFSDALTTVSPTYADEIQRPEYGHGFEGIVRSRSNALTGVLNGIDTTEWNPATDRYLPAPFSADDLSGKQVAKRALLELFGFDATDALMRRPIVGMVSRMTQQKGLDLIASLARQLPALDATFTVVGTGERPFENMWRGLAAAYPNRFGVFVGFDERRAHLVEAGADLFLMPSRFEPCGLNQMYSMRYGTVPLVRAVGGLVDTVRPIGAPDGTGFLFSEYHPAALWNTLVSALRLFSRHPDAWRRLQSNGMRRDFSWERSAAEYVKIYQRLTADRDHVPGPSLPTSNL